MGRERKKQGRKRGRDRKIGSAWCRALDCTYALRETFRYNGKGVDLPVSSSPLKHTGIRRYHLLPIRFEKKAAFDFIPPDERVTLNVGGHSFETTAGVLCRDRFSFLAAICKTNPPIEKDKEGAFFFDRDW